MPSITGPVFLTGSEIRTSGTTQDVVGVLGSKAETLDGRVFRAMEVGGVALVKGNLLQGNSRDSKIEKTVVT